MNETPKGFLRFDNFAQLNESVVKGRETLSTLREAYKSGKISKEDFDKLHLSYTEELESKNTALDEKLGIDHLTELYNLKTFEKRLGDLVEDVNHIDGERKSVPNEAMLVVLDLDNFKSVNEDYGHPVGDEALKVAADRLKKVIKRKNDAAFRLGGDENALLYIFNNTEAIPDKDIEFFFEEIKRGINDNLFFEVEVDENGSKVKKKIPITFAMGYAVLRRDKITTVQELRAEADYGQRADKESEAKQVRIQAAEERLLNQTN